MARAVAWIRSAWVVLLTQVARHRAIVLALLTTVASAILGLAITSQLGPWGLPLSSVSMGLIVLAGAVPHRYEAAERVATLLPVIHKVLGLQESDRIALHHLRAFPSLRYEQITNYYPAQRNRTRGRTFPLSHGIVAKAFQNIEATHWEIPAGEEFAEAMRKEWMFNREQVARLTPDRRSFLAVPILEQGPYAKAVLYLDSDRAETFADGRGDEIADQIKGIFLDHLAEILRES